MQHKNTVPYAVSFLIESQAKDEKLWEKTVDVFRTQPDSKGHGYRGEYWGKIMRGAVLLQKYSGDEKLYKILERTVKALLKTQAEDGRISSYKREEELCGWDVWCRKYVAVGLEYFLTICRDETLKNEIIVALEKHLTYIMDRVGEGKKPILATTEGKYSWGGINSSSILKAYVVLYEYTKNRAYLDFAAYIISCGGMKGINLAEAAYEDVVRPKNYPYPKAYETTSFFEGLLEYYKVTGDEKYLIACKNYAAAVLEDEFAVIGSAGCKGELFDGSRITQTVPRRSHMQETCVTVSLMLYFGELFSVTEDKQYIEAMERSFYNAYLGALDYGKSKSMHGLPIDWYSPLIGGRRNNLLIAGKQTFSDGSYYSCCTAIGAAGAGVMGATEIFSDAVQFYAPGKKKFSFGTVIEQTDYPNDGKVTFRFCQTDGDVTVRFRVPKWCTHYETHINGKGTRLHNVGGYLVLCRTFSDGDIVALEFKMHLRVEKVPLDGYDGGVLAVKKGPLVYALDRRFASLSTVVKGDTSFRRTEHLVGTESCAKIKTGRKKAMLVDYASAGKTMKNSSRLTVWIPYRKKGLKNMILCFINRHKHSK